MTRLEAKRNGRKRYTGKLCVRHPLRNGERFVSNSRCIGCSIAGSLKWAKNNPDRARANERRWAAENSERRANQHYVKRYGITKAQKEIMLRQQNDRCACCEEPTKTTWHVDHDHRSKIVRGVLCGHCNWMIGNALENPVRLLRGIQYLQKHTALFKT